MKFSFCIILLFISYCSISQEYQNAFGFRGGENWGPGYKFFANEKYAAEIMASFRKRGMQFTAIMESHRTVFLDYTDHIFYYYGIGAHVGYVRKVDREYDYNIHPEDYKYYGRSTPIVGGDFIAGLEYRFYRIPVAISVDWKPYFDFFGKPIFTLRPFDFGGTIKFTF